MQTQNLPQVQAAAAVGTRMNVGDTVCRHARHRNRLSLLLPLQPSCRVRSFKRVCIHRYTEPVAKGKPAAGRPGIRQAFPRSLGAGGISCHPATARAIQKYPTSLSSMGQRLACRGQPKRTCPQMQAVRRCPCRLSPTLRIHSHSCIEGLKDLHDDPERQVTCD